MKENDILDPRVRLHENLCREIHDLYIDKNEDYGDSFRKVRDEVPHAIVVRLSDKLNRLKSLMNKPESERKVKSETIDDTLMDIANYALMELVERKCDRCEVDTCADCYDEDESETFSDKIGKIAHSLDYISRDLWLSNPHLHTEIFIDYSPERDQYKMVRYKVENGRIIDSDVMIFNSGDDISLDLGDDDD